MSYLTADEQSEVRDMEEMFGTAGWKRFIDKHKEAIDILPKRAIAAVDEKELFIIKGQYGIMLQLVNYEDFYLSSIEALAQERQVESDRSDVEKIETRFANVQGL